MVLYKYYFVLLYIVCVYAYIFKKAENSTKLIFYIKIMKSLNNFAESLRYEAPAVEVVEINVERGFELSQAPGFDIDGDFTEEDVIW